MIATLQLRRGLAANLPGASSHDGEPFWTTDGHNLYIAQGGVKYLIGPIPSALIQALVSVVWGAPGAEAANAIEIAASCQDFNGNAFASDLVDVQIRVTDGATDADVSATATIDVAGTPVGTLLSGAGTATVVMRTDGSGDFKIKVTELSAGPVKRYLWVNNGGNARLWVRSSTGVVELDYA